MSFSPCPSGPLGCTSIQEQRERWERKRNCTARELVQTEQRYCQQLELVTTYFVEILKAKGTLRQDIRESIFSSIKAIHSINQSLLVNLENGYFGRGFEKLCPHLHHYNTFVDNIYNASKVLRIQLKKNKSFRRFKKLQEARPEFNNNKLEDLLQLPVQRIDQYKHFLQDLVANTSPDNPEFQQISRAVTAICMVSQRIQNNTQRHENHLQLCRVQKLLKGRKTKVLAAGRWYIREGWLKMVPAKGPDAKPKMFFLFSDMLLQAKRCSPLHPTNGDKFASQHAYPLQDCTVEKVFGHTRSQGGLLCLTFPKAKLLLMSSNQDDLNDWYQSLSSAIRQPLSIDQPDLSNSTLGLPGPGSPEEGLGSALLRGGASKLQSRTAVHQRDELCQRPLHSVANSRDTPSSSRDASSSSSRDAPSSSSDQSRKRNMVSAETSEEVHKPSVEWEASASKRMKQSDVPEMSSAQMTSSCVIL